MPADSFNGRIRPGPERVAIAVLPEDESYTIPGTSKRLYLPRPASHEGFTGKVEVEAAPYFDTQTGQEYTAIFKVGAIVVVGKFTGTSITLNRKQYIICRERDIVCEVIPESEDSIRAEARSQDTTA